MKSRKKELEARLFEAKGENFKPLEKREVEEFLSASAEGRQRLFQYTDLEAVVGILKSRELRLSRGSDLNDTKELGEHKERAKRTFVASFCRTENEFVAMWWLYGMHGKQTKSRIPVRVRFSGKALREAVEGQTRARIAGKKRFVHVKAPVWCDVIYQFSRGGKQGRTEDPSQCAIIFDGMVANGTRCKAFMDAIGEFPAYAKDGCWAYEEETRLTVELADEADAKGIRRIAIPIAGALADIEVCVGPGEMARKYCAAVEKRLKQEGFEISGSKNNGDRFAVRTLIEKDAQGREVETTQRVKIVDSRCAVRFAGKKKKRKKKAGGAKGGKGSGKRAAR